ncbi:MULTISPECIES: hypothetical protein [Rheinheimera]|uniref:Letm1 RBD domain-containing protein n=1 Tax=Rheinheimera marina TaxID=1774958 RepID=A0ABV9JI09_9GAMM
MNVLTRLHKAPIRVLRIQRRKTLVRFRFSMIRLRTALAQETDETRRMLVIYQRSLQGKATEAELRFANHQLVDVLRATGLGVFAVLPFAPITIPILIKLGRKIGIEVLPSSFQPRADRVKRIKAEPDDVV